MRLSIGKERSDYPFVVLCKDPTAKTKPYVVWFADAEDRTTQGKYCAARDEALAEFESRRSRD